MDAPSISGLWMSGGREYTDELIRFVVDTEATPYRESFREFKERLNKNPTNRHLDYCLSYPVSSRS